MLSKTTSMGIRILIYLGVHPDEGPFSPSRLGKELGESPSYLSKVAGLLTRAGIVRSHRGASGGIELNVAPERIRLLDVVQACQGFLLPDYCSGQENETSVCSFHQAMRELHGAMLEVLSQWTLADLLERTCPEGSRDVRDNCKIGIVREIAAPPKKKR